LFFGRFERTVNYRVDLFVRPQAIRTPNRQLTQSQN
jgi:hypothetical protein